jgi:hypothetical protein
VLALQRRVADVFALRGACSGGGGGGGAPEAEDGKMDGSFHSPAFLAAHIASLQARSARFREMGSGSAVLTRLCGAAAGDGAHDVRGLLKEAAGASAAARASQQREAAHAGACSVRLRVLALMCPSLLRAGGR